MSELEDALRVVLADMPVVPEELLVDDENAWLSLGEDEIWLSRDEHHGEALIAWLADRLQEDLPETREFWAEAVPRCPGHAHPLAPELLDGEAWWLCPADRRRVARIGRLAGADERQR